MEEGGGNRFFRVKFRHSSETELCRANGLELEPCARVIAVSRYGKDVGEVLGPVKCPSEIDPGSVTPIVRVATEQDIALYERNRKREKEAVELCAQKVAARGLAMKMIGAHFLPDESKVLFFFTADGRVDFRELVRDLVAVFRMRIELRQIGVRDESRVLGGMAVCGRLYCCHGVTDQLRPVSIKMAKDQGLSLNSMKISGPCGRLLCCLAYEYDYYREERRRFPVEGTMIASGRESFRVSEVNLISRKVVLVGSEGGVQEVPYSQLHYDGPKGVWNVDLPTENDGDEAVSGEGQPETEPKLGS